MRFRVTAVIAACVMSLASSANSAPSPVVKTTYGPVRGILTPGVAEFLGVRYAAPPTGNLRWTPPQPPTSWSAPMDATQFGNVCPQFTGPWNNPTGVTGDEDCLFLNVYVPTSNGTDFSDQGQDQGYPVMVWIHDSADLQIGAGSFYDPTPLVKKGGVIVVTINYRLSVFGFLAHPALSAETAYGGSGDYGLMDQQFAMSWVRQNIRAFGGNPHNVTVFGESASVFSQMASPSAAGLFNRAIAESGEIGVFNFGLVFLPLGIADEIGSEFAAAVGCQPDENPTTNPATAACLRLQTAQFLVETGHIFELGVPDVDGNVLTQSPDTAFQSGQFNRVPVINGTNHDEFRYFEAQEPFGAAIADHGWALFLEGLFGLADGPLFASEYPEGNYPSGDLAFATLVTDGGVSCSALLTDQALSQYVSTYAYEFADENAPPILPAVGFPQGAEYYSEAQYLFNLSAIGEPTVPFTASQQLLSNQMIRYWTDFATSGNPNSNQQGNSNQEGSSVWPRFSGPPAQETFLSLVPPSPVDESESAFSTDHKCASFWTQFLQGVQKNGGL